MTDPPAPPAPPLEYRVPRRLYAATFSFRSPAVLVLGVFLLLLGGFLMARFRFAARWPTSGQRAPELAAFLAFVGMTYGGGWCVWAFVSGRRRVTWISTDGIHDGRLVPWSRVLRVGGQSVVIGRRMLSEVRGIRMDYHTVERTRGPHGFRQSLLIADGTLSEAEFADVMAVLQRASPAFPHVWLDWTARSEHVGTAELRERLKRLAERRDAPGERP